MARVPVTFRLNPTYREAIEKAAQEDGSSFSDMMRGIINEALERRENPKDRRAELLQQLRELSHEELSSILRELGVLEENDQ